MAERFTWVEPYEAIATAVRSMADNPSKMIECFLRRHPNIPVEGIDPFTFMAMFNRGQKDEKRREIVEDVIASFDLRTDSPSDFEGIPMVFAANWRYQNKEYEYTEKDWRLFCAAVDYADNPGERSRREFKDAFDSVLELKHIGLAKLTVALFWIRPNAYLPLDKNTRSLLASSYGLKCSDKGFNAEAYLSFMASVKLVGPISYYALSAEAYQEDLWWPAASLYDPGLDASQWIELMRKPNLFNSDDYKLLLRFWDYGGMATCTELSDRYGESAAFYSNVSTALAKKISIQLGLELMVQADGTEKRWPLLYQGKNAVEGQKGSFVWKMRDSLYSAVEAIAEALDEEMLRVIIEGPAIERYSDSDFLSQVFVDEQGLADMKGLLARKKNLILQGAPGTGKTFAAKRLAWAVMGEKDDSRIKFVQFHQSSTYEDFMVGYKPNAQGGFVPQRGAFVEFCNRAASNPDKSHFFIIDEINRANISKVFGEMLMLIEADHRGDTVLLPLLDEEFCVPGNVYIIGMMNTADRGLALIDYALRRRFAFFEMKPALNALQFKARVEGAGNEKLGKLVQAVRVLNDAIAKDALLGRGFCVGHSYFCFDGEVSDEDVERLIRYELIPLIEEYWFDDQKRVQQESDALMAVLNG